MYNFPLIGRIAALQREAGEEVVRTLYDNDNNTINDFLSTWTVGSQVLYNSDNEPFMSNGDYHAADEYIYRIYNSIIIKKAHSLFDTSFGYRSLVYSDCENTEQVPIFFSNTYEKWKGDGWDEDTNWFDSSYLQNGNSVNYIDGVIESSIRYCPHSTPTYSSCIDAATNNNIGAEVFSSSEYPVNDWVFGTQLFTNLSMSAPKTDSFYINIGGTAIFVSMNNSGSIESIAPCNVGFSFPTYNTPYEAITSGYTPTSSIYSEDEILQVGSMLYSNSNMTTPAIGWFFTSSNVIETDSGGMISSMNSSFSYYGGYTDCSQGSQQGVYAYSLEIGRILYTNINNTTSGGWTVLNAYNTFMYDQFYYATTSDSSISSISACST